MWITVSLKNEKNALTQADKNMFLSGWVESFFSIFTPFINTVLVLHFSRFLFCDFTETKIFINQCWHIGRLFYTGDEPVFSTGDRFQLTPLLPRIADNSFLLIWNWMKCGSSKQFISTKILIFLCLSGYNVSPESEIVSSSPHAVVFVLLLKISSGCASVSPASLVANLCQK